MSGHEEDFPELVVGQPGYRDRFDYVSVGGWDYHPKAYSYCVMAVSGVADRVSRSATARSGSPGSLRDGDRVFRPRHPRT
jgi:hypothetical protein